MLKKSNKAANNFYTYPSNFLSRFSINIPLFLSLKKILLGEKFDLIVSRNYSSISFIPMLICQIKQIRFGYIKAFPLSEFFDFQSRNANDLFHKLLYRFRYYSNSFFETIIFKKANFIITRSDAFKEYLIKVYRISSQKIISIPMGFDFSNNKIKAFENDKVNQNTNAFRYSLLYFGSIEKIRNINFLLEIFEKTRLSLPEVNLTIIGGNISETTNIKAEVKKMNLEKSIKILENKPRDELFELIRNSRITISAIPPYSFYIVSSPTKVLESLGLGVPVVANEEILDQKMVVEKSQGGILVKYDTQEFAKAIINLLKHDIEHTSQMGVLGANYIKEERSYNSLALKLDKFLRIKIDER
ncbi:MAG: glycosyltransferase [Ignavibacteriaceae bacterium]|nr:glycosyltransferase [Ignavibacteriaceae bacterium]